MLPWVDQSKRFLRKNAVNEDDKARCLVKSDLIFYTESVTMAENKVSATMAMKIIADSNDQFVSARTKEYFEPHMAGQSPFVTLVSCSDSRVQPTVLLPDPIGKIFVIENVGNQVTSGEGSVDYGVLHLNTPVLLILGHVDCGAIKAFSGGYEKETPGIKRELDNLQGGLGSPGGCCADSHGDVAAYDQEIVRRVQTNVDHQVAFSLGKYRDRVKDGRLTVVGGVYDFRGVFGKGHGRMVVLNVNGETDPETIKGLPALERLKDVVVARVE